MSVSLGRWCCTRVTQQTADSFLPPLAHTGWVIQNLLETNSSKAFSQPLKKICREGFPTPVWFPWLFFVQTSSQCFQKFDQRGPMWKFCPWVWLVPVFLFFDAAWNDFIKFHSNTQSCENITAIQQMGELRWRLCGCGGSPDLSKTPKDSRDRGDLALRPHC